MTDRTAQDAEIRKSWEAGDIASATSAAIEQLGPEILRYLGSVLREPDAADEAFSLFCERIWSSLPRFEWKCAFRTWAYVIARRAAADVVRVEWRRQRRQTPLPDSRISAIAQKVRTATLPLLKSQGKTALARLREELPQEDRMLLVLRVDRGLAWEELARIFLDAQAPTEDDVRRESARLRKRFQLVKMRLRDQARRAGLLDEDKKA